MNLSVHTCICASKDLECSIPCRLVMRLLNSQIMPSCIGVIVYICRGAWCHALAVVILYFPSNGQFRSPFLNGKLIPSSLIPSILFHQFKPFRFLKILSSFAQRGASYNITILVVEQFSAFAKLYLRKSLLHPHDALSQTEINLFLLRSLSAYTNLISVLGIRVVRNRASPFSH